MSLDRDRRYPGNRDARSPPATGGTVKRHRSVANAVAAEREACAKVAEHFDAGVIGEQVARDIAVAIRARGSGVKSWRSLMYYALVGAVTRETGTGPWQAWRYLSHDNVLIPGEFATSEDAQRAVERACDT